MEKIVVPDYYKNFRCKCGECRRCCCSGWGITVPMSEYFKLLGIECSDKLRKRLDCAFYVLPDASPERYAKMKPDFLGSCPLQDSTGLCSLQVECGEEVLPSVCRMYPRNTLFSTLDEGACACSCEKVIEMLFAETDGVKLIELELPQNTQKLSDGRDESERELQLSLIRRLQDRTVPLSERLINFGKTLDGNEIPAEITDETAFRTITDLVAALESYSPSFSEYSIIAKEDLGIVNGEFDAKTVENRYKKAADAFKNRYPLCEIYFENVLINHAIFERFPFSQKGETPFEKFAELCATYALTRFVAVAYTENKFEETALVDCISGLFRCFEHSDADGVVRAMLKSSKLLGYAYLDKIVKI